MLILHNPVKFGNNDRFTAYQFDNDRFHREWLESYGNDRGFLSHRRVIFVQDNEQYDNVTGLPEIVFQEWIQEIESLEQIVSIVAKRYPLAF